MSEGGCIEEIERFVSHFRSTLADIAAVEIENRPGRTGLFQKLLYFGVLEALSKAAKPHIKESKARYRAISVVDLRVPPANRLEKLRGNRSGQWSIRINDQWRICFRWVNGDAFDVEIVDYH